MVLLWSSANIRPEDNWLLLQFHSGSFCLQPCRCSLCLPTFHSSCKKDKRSGSEVNRFDPYIVQLQSIRIKCSNSRQQSSTFSTDLFFTIQYFLPSTSSPSKPYPTTSTPWSNSSLLQSFSQQIPIYKNKNPLSYIKKLCKKIFVTAFLHKTKRTDLIGKIGKTHDQHRQRLKQAPQLPRPS